MRSSENKGMSYSTQHNLIMNKLLNYYSEFDRVDRMLAIIHGSSSVSLRLVDWFVTNYAKKNWTIIKSGDTRFKVYDEYKSRLKSYSKRRFDPFCRHERVVIPYKDESHIQTTIGQLNFFRWAIENNIIDYIEENQLTIEADMNNRNSTSRRKKDTSGHSLPLGRTRKRRQELSVLASKSVLRENVEIEVSFM